MKQVACATCGKTFAAKTQRRYCPECSHGRALERGRARRKPPQSISIQSPITEIAQAARSAGMTYGQFVAWMEKE